MEEIDLEGKDCFWYLYKFELHEVLSTKIFDLYVTFKWEGWIDLNASVFDYQTGYSYLKNIDMKLTPFMFSDLCKDMLFGDQSHLYHQHLFCVWKHSMKYRFLIESFFTFFLTIFFQYYISKFTVDLHIAHSDYLLLKDYLVPEQEVEEELMGRMDSAMTELKDALLVSSFHLLLPINLLIQNFYIKKTMRYYPPFNFFMLVDFCLFLAVAKVFYDIHTHSKIMPPSDFLHDPDLKVNTNQIFMLNILWNIET